MLTTYWLLPHSKDYCKSVYKHHRDNCIRTALPLFILHVDTEPHVILTYVYAMPSV